LLQEIIYHLFNSLSSEKEVEMPLYSSIFYAWAHLSCA